jgi:transposase
LHRACKEKKFAYKLNAILLLDKGFSCIEVADLLMLDDDTIRTYRNQYLNYGAESLITDSNKGTSPKLTNEQIDLLNKHLEQNTYSNSKGIVAWIKENFGVLYKTSSINALLKRMNFVYKKPVLVPCKADVAKQEEFVESYKELKESMSQNDKIYWVDGVHPQHNTIANYGWIKRGQTKQLKTNNGRQRTNINGALNLETKEVFYVEDERINSQTVIALLLVLLKNQIKGKIYIILDNAKYYHSQIVMDFLKDNPRIIFKFMPPYSPNLNIIERLWHILKKKVVYNKFYLKFADFQKAVNKFFENKNWLDDEYKNILTDKFQIIKPNFSGSYL